MGRRTDYLFSSTSGNEMATGENIKTEMENMGKRIKALILKKGWNQSELGRQAQVGRDSISKYIQGKTRPTPEHLKAMADALGVTPRDLISSGTFRAEEKLEGPITEMSVLQNDRTKAAVHIRCVMPTASAMKVIQIVNTSLLEEANGKTK